MQLHLLRVTLDLHCGTYLSPTFQVPHSPASTFPKKKTHSTKGFYLQPHPSQVYVGPRYALAMAPVPVSASKSTLLEAIGLHENNEHDEQVYRQIMVSHVEPLIFTLQSLVEPHSISSKSLHIYASTGNSAWLASHKVSKQISPQKQTLAAAARCTSFLPRQYRLPSSSHNSGLRSTTSNRTSVHTAVSLQGDPVPLFRM